LNLPSSLDALERPIGLPPSLLAKAETVRIDEGPTRIEASIEDVQRLAQQDLSILDEVHHSVNAMLYFLFNCDVGYGYT
jgi:programmed cell death 6-interacting protein